MGMTAGAERRALTAAEFELVSQTHHPAIRGLSREQLGDLVRRLRGHRDRARDISRQQRRELRGKAEPKGIAPATDNSGTKLKAQVLASAVKRANREMTRLAQTGKRASQAELSRRALEMKRANQVRHHPDPGQTAGEGMRSLPSGTRTADVDPREVGRVSQFVKDAQVQRDSR